MSGSAGLIYRVRRLLYLMAGFEQLLNEQHLKTRAEMGRLFVLCLSADLVGVPLLPSTRSLDLLPYVVPQIMGWRRKAVLEGEFPAAPGGAC